MTGSRRITGRLFVVDTLAIHRMFIRHVAQMRGFAIVGEAEDGPQAVAGAEASLPEILVIGHHPPRLDGIQVANRIRQQLPRLAVVGFVSRRRGVADAWLSDGANAVVFRDDLRSLGPTLDLVGRRAR